MCSQQDKGGLGAQTQDLVLPQCRGALLYRCTVCFLLIGINCFQCKIENIVTHFKPATPLCSGEEHKKREDAVNLLCDLFSIPCENRSPKDG